MNEPIQTTTGLVNFDRARSALALAHSIDEVKQIRDQAEAIRAYIKQQRGSFEMQNQAAEIKLRAERRAGEMLREQVRGQGQRDETFHDGMFVPPKLDDLGITYQDSHRWQLEADIPEERFEQFIAETKAAAEELTSRAAITIAQKIKREERIKEAAPFPTGKFRVLYADPPWAFNNSGFPQSAEQHYPTLTSNDIANFKDSKGNKPESLVSEGETVLFLWVPEALIPEGMEVIDAWGFEYKAQLIWLKPKSPGIGWWVNSKHEVLCLAANGEGLQPAKKYDSTFQAEVTDHSRKPSLVYEMIEAMYTGPYIELFARNIRPGWESWGNEVS